MVVPYLVYPLVAQPVILLHSMGRDYDKETAMDDIAQLWFQMEDHVQANLKVYLLGIGLTVPFLFFTRKWTIPLILYILEISIYCGLMHTFIYGLVGLAGWFKNSSSIRALRKDGMPVDAVNWGTPFVRFWDKELYDPQWLVYVECGFMVVIVLLVFRFRPMRTQKPKPRFGIDGKRTSNSDEAVAVAKKYGSKRYADDWVKDSAKPVVGSRPPDKLDR